MKAASCLLAIGFAASGLAEPLAREPPTKVIRDLATVTSVIAQVSGGLVQLDNSAKAFTSDPTQLESDAANLVSILKAGTTTIAASDVLSLTDAVGLTDSVTALQTAGQTLVDDLIAKKPQFEQAGLCSTVLASVTEINTDSRALIDATVSKVPDAAQPIAQALVAGLLATLDSGIAAFAQGNCTDATTATTTTGGGGGGATTTTDGGSGATTTTGGGSAATTTTTTTSSGGSGATTTKGSTTQATVTTTSGGSGATTTGGGYGASTTSSKPSTVTAGAAAMNAVGPVGILAGLAAALVL